MLLFDWQAIVVGLALAGSAAYLIRRAILALRSGSRRARNAGGCSSCSACPSGQSHSAGSSDGLVTLVPTLDSQPGQNDPRSVL